MRDVLRWVAAAGAATALAGCVAETQPARDVKSTSATLAASGHTDTSTAAFFFEYWPHADDVSPRNATPFRTVPAGVPGPGRGDVAFGEQVDGLLPGTAYDFRICGGDAEVHPPAGSGATSVCAATRTFTTGAGTRPDLTWSAVPGTRSVSSWTGLTALSADVDGDGHLDAILDTSGPASADLLVLSDGRGGFAPQRALGPAGSLAGSYKPVDVDGDGDLDLVGIGPGGTSVGALLGDGTGALRAGPATPAGGEGAYATDVALADADRDGRPDLVAHVAARGETTRALSVFLGDGRGGFGSGPSTTVPDGPGFGGVRLSAVADVSADGRPDVVDSGPLDDGGFGLRVRLGDGRGGFGPVATSPAPLGDVRLADFDGDDRLDALVTAATGESVVRRGDGRGGFRPAQDITNRRGTVLGVGDVDRDGHPDVVGVRSPHPSRPSDPGAIEALLGKGDGTFRLTPAVLGAPTTSVAGGAVVPDLFGDGRVGFLTAVYNGFSSLPFAGLAIHRQVVGTTSR